MTSSSNISEFKDPIRIGLIETLIQQDDRLASLRRDIVLYYYFSDMSKLYDLVNYPPMSVDQTYSADASISSHCSEQASKLETTRIGWEIIGRFWDRSKVDEPDTQVRELHYDCLSPNKGISQ